MANPELASQFLARHIERLRKSPKRRIVFPEGDDRRVQQAAARLVDERLVEPVLIGQGGTAPDARYARLLHERRKAKGMTEHAVAWLSAHPGRDRGHVAAGYGGAAIAETLANRRRRAAVHAG